jgi:hypothetical protein
MDLEKYLEDNMPSEDEFDENGFHKETGDHFRDYEDYSIMTRNRNND